MNWHPHDQINTGSPDRLGGAVSLEQRLSTLRRRLVRQASGSIGMLERALASLWALDTGAARAVRDDDDLIDAEEIAIERACHELLTLHKPVARDFRVIAFILKVNADIERVADHACGIAKATGKLASEPPSTWPTSLRELGERVPGLCHELLRAVLDEDADRAQRLVQADETIDRLERRVFDECRELIERDASQAAVGMRLHRVGRELERVGDLMVNVAEDVVYVETGTIIRHARSANKPGKQAAS